MQGIIVSYTLSQQTILKHMQHKFFSPPELWSFLWYNTYYINLMLPCVWDGNWIWNPWLNFIIKMAIVRGSARRKHKAASQWSHVYAHVETSASSSEEWDPKYQKNVDFMTYQQSHSHILWLCLPVTIYHFTRPVATLPDQLPLASAPRPRIDM